MKKLGSLAMAAGLVFVLALATTGCAGHSSDTMGDSSIGTTMESLSSGHMDEGMENTMDKGMDNTMETKDSEKMDSSMDKSMDTMKADTMDKGMDNDMQDSMMK